MAMGTNPAPRGTRAVVTAFVEALDTIPETHRKAVFKHAVATVRERLAEQSKKAKLASRRTPALPGAKRKAAAAVIRRTAAEQEAGGPSGPAVPRTPRISAR